MKAYQWDEQGYFVQEIEVDPSGELPPRTTFSSPPEGLALWSGGGWLVVDERAEIERDWVSVIAAARYAREIAGFVWEGFYIDTERDSQAKIDSSFTAAREGFRVEGSVWKCLDLSTGQVVSRPTSNDEMVDIGRKAYLYVQGCYNREGALLALVDKGKMTDKELDKGWP